MVHIVFSAPEKDLGSAGTRIWDAGRHKAYAHKQILLWERFVEEGEHKFRGKMIQ
jgi:hypothetical protein